MSLYDRVEDVLLTHHDPSSALEALRATASLTALLRLLRTDAARLTLVASNSYRHRNGFDKIVLAAPGGSPLKLVLHVWPDGGLTTSDNIHDHRWDFSSVVIRGMLRFELYEQDAEGENYAVMQYRPMAGVGCFELRRDGTTAVSVHAAVTMTVGSTYSWTRDRLHRAWGIPGQVTATLIVQGPPALENTTVLVSRDNAHQLDGPQSLYRLSVDEVDRTLAGLTGENVQAAWRADRSKSPVGRS
jgi:hypothetical protein